MTSIEINQISNFTHAGAIKKISADKGICLKNICRKRALALHVRVPQGGGQETWHRQDTVHTAVSAVAAAAAPGVALPLQHVVQVHAGGVDTCAQRIVHRQRMCNTP